MPDNAKLLVAAMALRGAAPDQWGSFTVALREYAASQISEMLRSPPEMLLKAQGMAQAMQELSQTMNEAPALYEKLSQRSANGRRTDPTRHPGPAFTG